MCKKSQPPHFKKALQVQIQLFGPESIDVVSLQLSVGMTYLNMKHFTKAYEYLEVAYNILKQHMGEDAPTTKDLKNTLDSLLELNLVKKK